MKVSALSTEDGDPLQKKDLVGGAQLMMSFNSKVYPVTFETIVTPLSSNTESKCVVVYM